MLRSADESTRIASDEKNSSGALAALTRWLPHLLTFLFVVGMARAVLKPLLHGAPWMTYEEDDFFYYLKVAQNLSHGAGSTFNGIVPTNGYHPLWLLLLTLVSVVTTSGRGVMLFLAAAIFIASVATYLLARVLLRRSGVGELMSAALAVYIAVYSMHLYTGGMEVLLTIPLLLGLIVLLLRVSWWSKSTSNAALLGLLASAVVLSRLDAIMLVGLLFATLAMYPRTRATLLRPKVLAGLALGLLPLVIYFASNQFYFHTWLPVSGMAKQLRLHHGFTDAAYHSLFKKTRGQLLTMLPVPLALLLLPVLWHRLRAEEQAIYPVVLAFPFVYLSVLSLVSDWGLWDWYFYTFRVGLCIALVLFCMWKPLAAVLRQPLIGVVAALAMGAFALRQERPTGAQAQLLEVAEDVREFAKTHPGVYAMGDRSGMVGYLLPDPLVQTEGLMMDRIYLDEVAHQRPLREVLTRYNVRYYIATTYPPYAAGCLQVSEPWQAGHDSAHMRAEFCEPPAAMFDQGDVRTLIYDLGPRSHE